MKGVALVDKMGYYEECSFIRQNWVIIECSGQGRLSKTCVYFVTSPHTFLCKGT